MKLQGLAVCISDPCYYLEIFFVKKQTQNQKAYFHIKMEPSFATSEFYENRFLSYFVSMHLFS